MDDKDGKDQRVHGAGRQGLSHIMQDQEKHVMDWEGGRGKFISVGNSFLLGYSYSLLQGCVTIAATLDNDSHNPEGCSFSLLHPLITSGRCNYFSEVTLMEEKG